MLDKNRIIELLKIECECVRRNSDQVCDRNCSACDLVQDDKELLAAFDGAIEMLDVQHETIQSLFNTIKHLCDGIASTAPRVVSVDDFIEGMYIPTVLWLERRSGDIVAGVWQLDHYELEDGTTIPDIGLEIAENPEAYNTEWRIWTAEPNEACKKAYPWSDEKEGGEDT